MTLQLDFKFHHFPNRNWNVSVRTEKKSNRFGSEYITKKVGPTLQIPKTPRIKFEMNALQINEVDNEVLNDADQYLREHRILELFEVRCPFS